MKTDAAEQGCEEFLENMDSVETRKKESGSDDGLWAGMMTASVFGGKLFPEES